MLKTKIFSVAFLGIDATIIEVEADMSKGLRSFSVVGLPDNAVREARERISSALKNSGFQSPDSIIRKIRINLAPADIKKTGSHFDLPISIAVLKATEQILFDDDKTIFIGELGLDGSVKPVKGVLLATLKAKEEGFKKIFLPFSNAKEASLIKDIEIFPISHLAQLLDHIKGNNVLTPFYGNVNSSDQKSHLAETIDFSDIRGQENAKRALEIAAAGAHNILFFGPPGSGKTLLARAFSSILPELNYQEIIETTKIYSVAGLLNKATPFVNKPPYRAPHHTISETAMVGGGPHLLPGEISLAHNGVLFLDELPEFHRNILEALRQPLEEGKIQLTRAIGKAVFPASFILIGAYNPCPCGFYNDPQRECTCSVFQVHKYQRKISGPIKDRIDMQIFVPRIESEKVINLKREGSTSEEIKKRVQAARKLQIKRQKMLNSRLNFLAIKKYCSLDEISKASLKAFADKFFLSPRQIHRTIKVARTIADLEGAEHIQNNHILEALQYRVQ